MLNLRVMNQKEKFLMFFLMCSYAIIPIVHGRNIFGYMEYLFLALIPFLRVSYIKAVYKYFSFIFVTLLSVSLVVWVLVMLRLPIPSHTIDPLNELKTITIYQVYPFLVVMFNPQSITDILRFCCVFDEPGVVGTITLIMLYINGFNLKKNENIVLLLAGVASFSLFFFVGAAVYYLYLLFKTKGRIKTKIAIIVAGVGIYIAVMNVPILYDFIGSRLEFDQEKGTIAGDSRAHEDLLEYFPKIRGTSKYFWGDTVDRIEEFSGSAGYRNVILRFGAVFLFLFIVFWVMYSLYSSKKDKNSLLLFWALFIATLYQRPGVVAIDYLFLFTAYFGIRNDSLKLKNEVTPYSKSIITQQTFNGNEIVR